MQRVTSVLFGLTLLAAIALVVWRSDSGQASKPPAPAPSAASSGETSDAGPVADSRPAGGAEEAEDPSSDEDGGGRKLGDAAPKRVRWGAILVTYKGAERGARSARSKQAALELARSLIPEAKKDFSDAVKKGDRGSDADLGTVPRGVLEAPLEYVLFSLGKGEVHEEPVDYKTGYLVVRRAD